MNPTIDRLVKEYGTGELLLEGICERYFGIGYKLAAERATSLDLPVPAYKTARNASWHVRVEDLAKFLDKEAKQAQDRWLTVRGAA